ncbi:MAG: methionyl-tRNA formyltransferase [Clostridia bacterium]|nr:methionyl-tRNA formyltransferase [Clostridia bacterium]
MKIVFLGSSKLSVISLEKLTENGHEILAVVCQPDEMNSRGNKIEISELKKYAISQNIPVYQFNKIRNEGVEILRELNPELLVVVFYGQILSQQIIDIASKGIINLHPSLLPKHRGPSPVITPILNGEKETGVTIMRIEKGIDSGDIILQEKAPIFENETAGELWERLTTMGSNMLIEAIKQIENNQTKEIKQDHSQATFTRMFKKEDAKIDFSKSSEQVVNGIRGFNPNPVAFFEYKEDRIKVYEAENLPNTELESLAKCGEIVKSGTKEGLIIKCGNGYVSIKKLQAPNGKILNIKDFLNGKKFDVGYILK